MSMDWRKLLSSKRAHSDGSVGTVESDPSPGRTIFQRDHDLILFSTAFRRLHDKAQVFPLPENDLIHSRLTHSLEVAAIGRSLGTLIGAGILERHPELGSAAPKVDARDIGDIVAAACLAHDIGNPPFGHAGEGAIAEYFASKGDNGVVAALTPRQQADLKKFEGNAQGFRIITRTQLPERGGMRLSAATLGAFVKYPREAGPDLDDLERGHASCKKYGFFQTEADIMNAVATELGLLEAQTSDGGRRWCRHPLAFVVEAADDICNRIIDVEDGVRLRLVDHGEAVKILNAIIMKDGSRKEAPDMGNRTPSDDMGYRRAKAMSALIGQVADVFKANETDMLAGTFETPIAKLLPSCDQLQELENLARDKCYVDKPVLAIEAAGYSILGELLSAMVPWAEAVGSTTDPKALRRVLPGRVMKLFQMTELIKPLQDTADKYERILRITDFVSGMTDGFALRLYQQICGVALPVAG